MYICKYIYNTCIYIYIYIYIYVYSNEPIWRLKVYAFKKSIIIIIILSLLRSNINLLHGTKFQGINYAISDRLVIIPPCGRIIKNLMRTTLGSLSVSAPCFELCIWRFHEQYGDHSLQCQSKQVAHSLPCDPVLSVWT